MEELDIVEFVRTIPFFPGANDRVNNEVCRMKSDMERLLSTWTMDQIRSVFTGTTRYRCRVEQLQGASLEDLCRSALRVGGLTFLTDAIYLTNFEMAERLRHAKLNVLAHLISRDDFFRPKNHVEALKARNQPDDVAIFDLLRLPPEMIEQIMQRSAYKDAQSLAVSCSAANTIYRNNSINMILPNIVLVLDFSSGELTVRWWLEKDQEADGTAPDANSDKINILNKENGKKKNQLLKNTTLLKVVTTDDFEPEYCEVVRNFLGNSSIRRVVVQGFEYTENMKMMVEVFNKETVEMEVNKLTEDYVPFPDIKTISIRDNLNTIHGERLFAAKQFLNITCGLYNVDSFRKAILEWDLGQREIGRWVILKQFTIFQTPFGQRHRAEAAGQKGYLQFLSELNSSQMLHGEITEYVFRPTD